MAELLLDVHLEFDPVALAAERDPTQTIAEASRHVAEERCAEQGATLRHPDPRDVTAQRATSLTTGADVLLVATRWLADGPENPR
ncbi:MAG: hypothetical protein LC798_03130 [Chloroflexi bacterium]|nr:hypothetical protein [Chloroflexota bacterium]